MYLGKNTNKTVPKYPSP